MKNVISTTNAPGAIGPYSQGIVTGDMLFISGQLPIDPSTNNLAENDIKSQTAQSLKNMKAIIEASGLSMANVIKTTVFLSDMNNFNDMNKVYSEFFTENYPARSAFEVARLPKDALVEIEAIISKS